MKCEKNLNHADERIEEELKNNEIFIRINDGINDHSAINLSVSLNKKHTNIVHFARIDNALSLSLCLSSLGMSNPLITYCWADGDFNKLPPETMIAINYNTQNNSVFFTNVSTPDALLAYLEEMHIPTCGVVIDRGFVNANIIRQYLSTKQKGCIIIEPHDEPKHSPGLLLLLRDLSSNCPSLQLLRGDEFIVDSEDGVFQITKSGVKHMGNSKN